MDAAIKQREEAAAREEGCGLSQVLFYVDGDTTQPKCGECNPHATFITELCAIDEYCTDEGVCNDIGNHPLLGLECPHDLGGWCGPSLRCYEHRCVSCLDGMISGGMLCWNGRWNYDRWNAILYDPTATFLLVITTIIGAHSLFKAIAWLCVCNFNVRKKKKMVKKKEATKSRLWRDMTWTEAEKSNSESKFIESVTSPARGEQSPPSRFVRQSSHQSIDNQRIKQSKKSPSQMLLPSHFQQPT